jgi:hypothetical protein
MRESGKETVIARLRMSLGGILSIGTSAAKGAVVCGP